MEAIPWSQLYQLHAVCIYSKYSPFAYPAEAPEYYKANIIKSTKKSAARYSTLYKQQEIEKHHV